MSLSVPVLPPLPPVIEALAGPSHEKRDPKIIIIYSKDIDDQIPLLSQYGKVVKWNSSLININIQQIDCDYLLVPASDKVALQNAERHFDDDNIEYVHYAHFWEVDFYDDINAVTKFKHAKDAADFNKSILNEKKLKSPSKIITCLSFLVNFFVSLKK